MPDCYIHVSKNCGHSSRSWVATLIQSSPETSLIENLYLAQWSHTPGQRSRGHLGSNISLPCLRLRPNISPLRPHNEWWKPPKYYPHNPESFWRLLPSSIPKIDPHATCLQNITAQNDASSYTLVITESSRISIRTSYRCGMCPLGTKKEICLQNPYTEHNLVPISGHRKYK